MCYCYIPVCCIFYPHITHIYYTHTLGKGKHRGISFLSTQPNPFLLTFLAPPLSLVGDVDNRVSRAFPGVWYPPATHAKTKSTGVDDRTLPRTLFAGRL